MLQETEYRDFLLDDCPQIRANEKCMGEWCHKGGTVAELVVLSIPDYASVQNHSGVTQDTPHFSVCSGGFFFPHYLLL